jgi:hypothetical protein
LRAAWGQGMVPAINGERLTKPSIETRSSHKAT